MRASSLLSAMILGAGLAVGATALAQTPKPAPAAEARPELSMPQIHDKLVALGYWNIDKIERDPGSYEVRAHDRNGDRVKLYLDARTGEILERRVDGRKRSTHDRRGADDGQRNSADCNERRCRDDLPPKGATSPAGGA
jgi:hypothetical protein